MTEYRRFPPAAALAHVVEHYWSVVSEAPVSEAPVSEAPIPPAASPRLAAVLVPNGRPTLQFCLGAPGTRRALDAPPVSNADVYLPVSTRPLVIEQEGSSHYVGVQCTPWGGRALFPQLTGEQPVQVEDAAGSLPERRGLAEDPAGTLDAWLGALGPSPVPQESLLAAAVRRIDADPSAVEVSAVCRELAISASTLYRAFRRGIGLAPKQYIQVMRHRAFTDRLLAETDGEPAALAAALTGYADQPHATREFARFTGMTVSSFRDTYDGIARLMARTDEVAAH
ncbi:MULTISPECIES: AraC family transcriptional regulator [Actinomycetes]|uniref:HTH araC/xylS-type domain-containing protein n=2 Tax=Actinomycetes TaxID=1760 RepID=A0ABP6M0F2_9MICC